MTSSSPYEPNHLEPDYGSGASPTYNADEPTAPVSYEANSPLYTEPTTVFGTEPTTPFPEAPAGPDYSSSKGPDYSAPGTQQQPQTQQPAFDPYATPLYDPYANSPYSQPSAGGYDLYGQPVGGSPYGAPMVYGGVQPSPYGPYQPTYGLLPEHPSSTAVLVLGLLGPLSLVTAPIAWYLGARARAEVRRGAPYRTDGTLMVGYVLGIVVSCLAIFTVLLGVLGIVGLFAGFY